MKSLLSCGFGSNPAGQNKTPAGTAAGAGIVKITDYLARAMEPRTELNSPTSPA